MTARKDLDQALLGMASEGRRPRCGDYGGAELWLSDDAGERRQAAAWCSGCELLDLCHLAAVEGGEKFGVWGGIDRTVNPRKPGTA